MFRLTTFISWHCHCLGKQGTYLPSLSLLHCEMAVTAIPISWGHCEDRWVKCLAHVSSAPSLKAPPVNCCCMVSSKLARPRRRLEAPQSGVPQSHWNTVKYPEQEREEDPRGGSWRVEHCRESQGQPLTAGLGGRRGLHSSPPALAQRGCIPTLTCVHPYVKLSTYWPHTHDVHGSGGWSAVAGVNVRSDQIGIRDLTNQVFLPRFRNLSFQELDCKDMTKYWKNLSSGSVFFFFK